MTRDAAEALKKLERDLAAGEAALAADEARRPEFARKVEDEERAGRAAELALAKATADHAGVEAEWRVAEAEVAQAGARLARLDGEARRIEELRTALTAQGDPEHAMTAARHAAGEAAQAVDRARAALLHGQANKEALTVARDEAASALATARAELAGIEREWQGLARDREARARQAAGKHGLPAALDRIAAEPGYERALAAAL